MAADDEREAHIQQFLNRINEMHGPAVPLRRQQQQQEERPDGEDDNEEEGQDEDEDDDDDDDDDVGGGGAVVTTEVTYEPLPGADLRFIANVMNDTNVEKQTSLLDEHPIDVLNPQNEDRHIREIFTATSTPLYGSLGPRQAAQAVHNAYDRLLRRGARGTQYEGRYPEWSRERIARDVIVDHASLEVISHNITQTLYKQFLVASTNGMVVRRHKNGRGKIVRIERFLDKHHTTIANDTAKALLPWVRGGGRGGGAGAGGGGGGGGGGHH